MPQAVYRLAREGGGQLAMVTTRGARIPGQEIRSTFLCSSCEDLLSREGETETLKWGWRAQDGTFALRDALVQTPPLVRMADGSSAYAAASVPGLPSGVFLHFASGVLWKASAHSWMDGTRRLTRCSMGPYQEPFRRYLLGDAPSPDRARLVVHVVSDTPPLNSFFLPYKNRWGEGWKHTFAVPGLIFIMFIGKTQPLEFDRLSPATFLIFLGPGADNQLFANARELPRKVPALGALREGLQARGLRIERPRLF